ncbi:MAG: WYL domain-containing protein [Bacteroidales bacterium]|nr:WYL domain-containing protein [Bacteroidales bacterium]
MVTELIQKYIWLIQTFIKAGSRGLLLEEIARAWELRWGTDYSRRTFNNHRQAIEQIFGIGITCDRRTNRYHVPYAEDVADTDATEAWLINTFTVNNLLTLGKERLNGRVSVEDVPSGQRWLTLLMEAMTGDRVVVIRYRKYTRQDVEELHVHPHALKEFARRWYLVGWCEERSAERVYGLDRILDITVEDRTFRMPEDYDVEEAFATSFGIYLPDGRKAEDIEFRATEREARYLRDLPLHRSQKEVRNNVFRIRVVPDDDVIMEFCRLGSRVEVLGPDTVREQVSQALKDAYKQYNP